MKNFNSEQNDQRQEDTIVTSYFKIFNEKSPVAIALIALFYFSGWRFITSYYGNFGLNSDLLSLSIIEVFSSGWRIYFIILFLLLVFYIGHVLLSRFVLKTDKKHFKFLFSFFYVSLSTAIILILVNIYRWVFVFGAHSELQFYLLALLSLIALFISTSLGNSLFSVTKHYKFFNFIYPDKFFWSAVFIITFVGYIVVFSSWMGLLYSRRDQGIFSTLQKIEIHSVDKLLIPGEVEEKNQYAYKDLRLLYVNEEYLFTFRNNEIEDGIVTLYAVPVEKLEGFSLVSWFSDFN